MSRTGAAGCSSCSAWCWLRRRSSWSCGRDPTGLEPWSADDADPQAYAAELVVETNAARADEGLPALTVSECATTEATERADDLSGGKELEHAPLTPVIEACAPAATAAENLARAAATPHDVVEAWLDSPGHRANLLDPDLDEVGIGCLLDGGRDALLAGVPRPVAGRRGLRRARRVRRATMSRMPTPRAVPSVFATRSRTSDTRWGRNSSWASSIGADVARPEADDRPGGSARAGAG